MCGCEKHQDKSAECTCICEEHQNFTQARELAMERYDRITELKRENVDLRRKLDSLEAATYEKGAPLHEDDIRSVLDDDKAPERDRVGAFMDYDQQGVALFLGGGNVLIIQDDETTAGNALELTDTQRAVLGARLRKISNLIVTRQLS